PIHSPSRESFRSLTFYLSRRSYGKRSNASDLKLLAKDVRPNQVGGVPKCTCDFERALQAMPVITKVADYDVVGFRDLINPPNLPEHERLRPFTAKLFFLYIRDGSEGEIIPKLLKGHTPPKTSALPYKADGN